MTKNPLYFWKGKQYVLETESPSFTLLLIVYFRC